MAYMFQTVDENESPPTVDASVTKESTELRRGAQAIFVGCIAMAIFQPWTLPLAAFGCIATGAIILATKPTGDCQEQIDTEIKRKRFGCAWLWWMVMAAIILAATYIGMAGGAVVYMEMRGIR
jgi:uncharacterized protein (DUF2062 family)